MRTFLVIILMFLSILYLINPGMGLFEFIPDSLPLVGNMDEAGATALLLMCFRYFGVDVAKLFERKTKDVIEV